MADGMVFLDAPGIRSSGAPVLTSFVQGRGVENQMVSDLVDDGADLGTETAVDDEVEDVAVVVAVEVDFEGSDEEDVAEGGEVGHGLEDEDAEFGGEGGPEVAGGGARHG